MDIEQKIRVAFSEPAFFAAVANDVNTLTAIAKIAESMIDHPTPDALDDGDITLICAVLCLIGVLHKQVEDGALMGLAQQVIQEEDTLIN